MRFSESPNIQLASAQAQPLVGALGQSAMIKLSRGLAVAASGDILLLLLLLLLLPLLLPLLQLLLLLLAAPSSPPLPKLLLALVPSRSNITCDTSRARMRRACARVRDEVDTQPPSAKFHEKKQEKHASQRHDTHARAPPWPFRVDRVCLDDPHRSATQCELSRPLSSHPLVSAL